MSFPMKGEIPPLLVSRPRGFGGPSVLRAVSMKPSDAAPAAYVCGVVRGRKTTPATGFPAELEKPMQTLHCSPNPERRILV
jgi:hypothetical protein